MSSKPKLVIDWCSLRAAEYSVRKWHYSKKLPAGKMVRVGVWEDDEFIGCVIFSRGACPYLGTQFDIGQDRVCELTRVALGTHAAPVSRILGIAIRFLRRHAPGLELIVSYADLDEGHHGGIYQATNWVYAGKTGVGSVSVYLVNGRKVHNRNINERCLHAKEKGLAWVRKNLDPNAEAIKSLGKHKYLMPLTEEMRDKCELLGKTYPKRKKQAMAGSTGTAAGQNRPLRSNSQGGDKR